MPSLMATLVADLQRHLTNEARFAGMGTSARDLHEQGMRRQADIAEFILSQPDPIETKAVSAYFDVTVECARKHANELAEAGRIVKISGYPTRWWRQPQ